MKNVIPLNKKVVENLQKQISVEITKVQKNYVDLGMKERRFFVFNPTIDIFLTKINNIFFTSKLFNMVNNIWNLKIRKGKISTKF